MAPMNSIMPGYISIKQAAFQARVGASTISKWIRDEKISALRVAGNKVYIRQSTFSVFLKKRKKALDQSKKADSKKKSQNKKASKSKSKSKKKPKKNPATKKTVKKIKTGKGGCIELHIKVS